MMLAEGDLLATKSVDVVEAIGQEDGKGWIVGIRKSDDLDSGRLKGDGTARSAGQLSCYAPSMC